MVKPVIDLVNDYTLLMDDEITFRDNGEPMIREGILRLLRSLCKFYHIDLKIAKFIFKCGNEITYKELVKYNNNLKK